MHSKLFQDKQKYRKHRKYDTNMQYTMHSKFFQDKQKERKHRKYDTNMQYTMHSKLFQHKRKERKHHKYAYKHAIHYAFQALPGQAKISQTP